MRIAARTDNLLLLWKCPSCPLQADGAAPAHQRLNFKHVFDAMSHIVRDGKGPLALWQGVGPTVTRSMALNAGQLLTNDIARSALGKGSGGLGLDQSVAVFGASFLAGTAGAALSLPFDLVKTRIQRMPPPAPGGAQLAGAARAAGVRPWAVHCPCAAK